MFVTISSNPSENTVITGGRNIHDGFVFEQKPDFSKYPELQQSPKGAWPFWNDLEIKVTSKEVAESSFAHLLKLWNRKVRGQVVNHISDLKKDIPAQDVLASEKTMMRHFLSLPFNDDHALEKMYVEMIDKAESSIMLSSPYLRPTKAIMQAFKRAIERKVHITIQTRINLAGDTAAWLYEETNKAAINDLYEHVDLYEWAENSILHTKMMVIDEKLAFFGSVNLSRRSFIQDVESGFIIYDPNFVSRLVDMFDLYRKKSHAIKGKQKRKFWASLVVNLLENQF
jgi:phosphatidylserine/phosphatidylglycerophosphate/cardiolipin synthase-like enzyme